MHITNVFGGNLKAGDWFMLGGTLYRVEEKTNITQGFENKTRVIFSCPSWMPSDRHELLISSNALIEIIKK